MKAWPPGSPADGPRIWRAAALWMGLLALMRLAMVAVLAKVTSGAPFTDDTFHMEFIERPLGIFTGQGAMPQSFPPLLPPLVWLVGKPLSLVLGEFAVLRVTYIVFELASWPVIVAILRGHGLGTRAVHLAGAIMLAAPLLWMTDAVMAQEETISLLFMALLALAVTRRRWAAAILVASLGVVAAKVFFLVAAPALVLYPPAGRWRLAVRGALAAAPIAAVYGLVALTKAESSAEAFARFTPPVQQTTTFWALLANLGILGEPPGGAAVARAWSAPLALAAGLAPLGWVLLKGPRHLEPRGVLALIAAMLAAVYTTFYHINPEYFVIFVPLLIATLPPAPFAIWTAAALSAGWAVNFTYGVAAAEAGATEGKAVFVDLYHAIVPAPPQWTHMASLVAFVAVTAVLTLRMTAVASRATQSAGAVAGRTSSSPREQTS